ncbi:MULTISPECIES: MarR family transcriptional regulator [Vagococcus]|uniref:HTH-type transcriptional regulator SarZ n=1 Tax=Vagococcus fluvialis bH819 TaxID=1255619 RepID=A0A1X6WLF8_9ENTE|nr:MULTISPECIES: MarR family transcriptional regulator [Vagococcus]SLM85089.1 Transcriptional regulator, MarR family [Vagococcus fluvialis bH819]HCM88495.1 hypothetical protein [Vagococcus sp.]
MVDNVNFDIYQTLHAISRDMHHLAHYIGGRQGEMQDLGRSLNFIRKNKRVTSKNLANYYQIKSSSVTVKVNKMIEQGYIDKTRDTEDLRVYYLMLTKKGEEKCHEINESTQLLIKDLFDDLTTNQKLVLLDELQTIEGKLVEKKKNWE